MRWLKYILPLMMIYLVCSARTCTEDEEIAAKREEQSVIKLMESVEDVFTSDTLGNDLLRAYEKTAIDKLNDFADYLKIASDTTLEIKFRQHAAELAKDLFIHGEIEFKSWSKVYGEPGLNTLELLIKHCLSEDISCRVQLSQIDVVNPFVRVNDSTCTGSLSFIQNCTLVNDPEKSVRVSGKIVIDIYIIRVNKNFGDKQFRVWEVYLGDMD